MIFTILVPTYNNLKYLKLFCESIKNNSNYDHQLVFHVNNGSDGSYDYIYNNRYQFTYSKKNIGLCSSIKEASKLINNEYILYAHDDMYFCKDWDLYLETEVKKYNNILFYISGTNVSHKVGIINYDCGSSPENFNIEKFNEFCKNDLSQDLQGSHWAPHLIHKNLWNKVGGFSEEFNPGDGSDPDLCMKLWNENVRIFKCLSKFKVYHFGSVTTRKRDVIKNNGTKKFLLKWGFNPRFFRKHYLKGDGKIPFKGLLTNPKINFNMIYELGFNKLKYFYHKFI